eukprot:TRINITY_DN3381_c0_g1_i2.p1 TRINITY_DN3381_c0_g1~~TRINITY_DN3381_c0_g1_i2.p1  ORF type:complete len:238 (+),score=81.49 TRINITY_DN3381_c0_g1_i2:192-905(+)
MLSAFRSTLARRMPVVGRRGFANMTEEVNTELSFVPLRLHGLSGRYASALYSAANKAGQLAVVEDELPEVLEFASEGPLKDLIDDPFVARPVKKAAVEEVLKKAQFSSSIVGFFGTLAENNRLSAVDEIAADFERIMGAHRGVVEMTLYTPEAMPYHHKAKLLRKITNDYLNPGDIIDCEEVIDEDILGGFVAEFQGMRIDESAATRLEQLEELADQTAEKLMVPPQLPNIPRVSLV